VVFLTQHGCLSVRSQRRLRPAAPRRKPRRRQRLRGVGSWPSAATR
jgi:hypothetical protein